MELDVIIYRVREQGLEVFMVNPGEQASTEGDLPQTATFSPQQLIDRTGGIELESVVSANGDARKAIAIEADWHEIPSLRALMYEDYRVAKQKAKQHLRNLLPEGNQGAYVAIKEAVKRVMPEQYAVLKELKDIIVEKNQTKYI